MTVSGFVQVGFDKSGAGLVGGGAAGTATVLGVVTITPEVSAAILAAGFDVSTFDVFHWPIGAARWGHGRYLIHENTYNEIFTDFSSVVRQTFRVGPVVFDKVFARGPQPIFISEKQGIVYAIEVVDERFFLNQRRVTSARFNVSTDDRTKLYKSSLKDGETEYTPREAIDEILTEIGLADFELPATVTELDDADNLRDFDLSGQTVGEIVDTILAACGCVFIAHPSASHAGFNVRYTVRTLASGSADAKIFLDEFNADFLGGGMIAPPRDIEDPTEILSLRSLGQPRMLDSEVPFDVEVAFPMANEGGTGYVFNDDRENETNRNFVTDRFHVINPALIEATGFPKDVIGNEQTFRIYDGVWAIVDSTGTVTNSAALATRATAIAKRYYDRYRTGAGHYLYRGILIFGQWSGALDVSYSVTDAGPFTRISSTFHDPRYGYSRREHLSPDDILAIGGIRPIPRPDGRLLLDSPVRSVTRYPATVYKTLYDQVAGRDRFAFSESSIDQATREWEDGGSGRTSLDGSDDFKNFASAMRSFPTATSRRGSIGWLREYASDEGETFRFFEYAPPFAVSLTKVGGVVGNRTTATTWSYAVRDFFGNLLSNSLLDPITPDSRIATLGPLTAATLGLACYDGDGKLKLLWSNESLMASGCP